MWKSPRKSPSWTGSGSVPFAAVDNVTVTVSVWPKSTSLIAILGALGLLVSMFVFVILALPSAGAIAQSTAVAAAGQVVSAAQTQLGAMATPAAGT